MKLQQTNVKSPYKILFLNHNFWPHVGGVEQQALKLAQGLSRQGFDVCVLTAKHKAGLASYELVEGVPVYRFWYPHFLPVKALRKMMNVIAGFLAFPFFVAKYRFDLVHIHQMQWLTLVGAFYKPFFKYKLIGKLTNTGRAADAEKFYQTQSLAGPILRLFRVRETVYAAFERIIAITKVMEKEMNRYGYSSRQVHYIPNGVQIPENNARRHWRAAKDTQTIVSAIRFVPAKFPLKQIRAIHRVVIALRKRNMQVKACLFGEGELLAEAREYVRKNNLINEISLPGAQPNAVILDAMSRADILLNVTQSEGLSNTVLEGMAAGLSIVISDVGGARDLIGELYAPFGKKKWTRGAHGILVKPNISSAELGRATRELLLDEQFRYTSRKNASKYVREHYSMDYITEQYAALYNLLLSQKSL